MKDKAKTKNQFSDLIGSETRDISHSRLITASRVWLEVADVMSKVVTTISPDETVLSATKRMCENNISCIIVLDNARVAGILTETDLLKGIAADEADFNKMPVTRIMSWPVESIPPDLSVLEAGKIAEAKHIKKLPVLDGEKLVGIVTQTDLIQVLTSYGMWSDVVEVMNKDVVSIQSQTTVTEAVKAMASCKISCIVVVEGDDVVGVFTEKDLLKKVVALQKNPAHTKIEEVMSSPVISIPSDYSLFSAAKAMEKMRIRRLVVIEDKKLCGIITQTNIFMAIKDKLQKEEEKNLGLLAESGNSIFTVDLNWKTTYVNPTFMKLLEVSEPTKLIGQPFLPEKFWFNPEERNLFLRELEKGNGNIGTAELSLRTCKGNRLRVTIFATLTKNVRGQINGRQGMLYDNTERKQVEEKFTTIIQTALDGFWINDLTGRILNVNDSYCRMSGYTRKELLTMSIADVEVLEKPEEISEHMKKVIDQGHDCFETCHRRKDGGIIDVEISVNYFDVDEGQMVVFLRDITARKRAKEALQKANEELREQDRLKNEFVVTMSHELRTPLTIFKNIISNALAGVTGRLNSKLRRDLETANEMIGRLAGITNDFLDISKIEVGKMKLNYTRLAIQSLVTKVVEMLKLLADNKNIDLIASMPDGELLVNADYNKICQILSNLIDNAVKFVPDCGGKIIVRVKDLGADVGINIEDNGPGIQGGDVNKVFGRFVQLRKYTGPGKHGTGLGLAITKELVELNGGRIWVENIPTGGARFCITLPKCSADFEKHHENDQDSGYLVSACHQK